MRKRIVGAAVLWALIVMSALVVVSLCGCVGASVSDAQLTQLQAQVTAAQQVSAQLQAMKPSIEAAIQASTSDTAAQAKYQAALNKVDAELTRVNGILKASQDAIAALQAKPVVTVPDVVTAAGGVVATAVPLPWGAIIGALTTAFAGIWGVLEKRKADSKGAQLGVLVTAIEGNATAKTALKPVIVQSAIDKGLADALEKSVQAVTG